jgi:hypothetical protein
MSLLYFHSPLPPAEGGIADYAFETLAQLKDQFDTVIIDDGDCRTSADTLLLPTIPAVVWRHLRKRSPAGLDIYHLGNNRFHLGILQRALAQPGLCVFHDASLTHRAALNAASPADRYGATDHVPASPMRRVGYRAALARAACGASGTSRQQTDLR